MSETIISESDKKPCLIGQRVILKGLRSVYYNRKAGKIISMPKSKQDCRYGVLVDGSTAPIKVRPENISLSNKYIIPQENHISPFENYAIRAGEGAYLDTDDLCHLKLMMNLFMTDDMQKKVYGRRISTMPNFCREIKRSGFPFGVDVGWAEKYLQQSFETSRSLPQLLELAFRCSDYEPDPIDIINRLGNADEKKLEWYFGERSKSTNIFHARDVEPYESKVRYSFSDQCYRKEDLKCGTTHVAVGFIDLGILLSANLQDPPSDSHVGPLRFIGVEKSPYAVAKSLVLWEMMKNIPAGKENSQKIDYLPAIRSILQVWFSATWDHPTEGFVRRALVSVRSSTVWESLHPRVQTFLNHWEEAPTVSVSDARHSIIESTSSNCSFIPNMCREKDRLALSKYELTKDFCIYNQPYCGNLLMFSCPDGTLPLNRGETIFSAFNFNDVMQILVNRVKAGCEISTIIDAAERYALSEILKLVTWVRNDQITLNLICGDIRDMVEFVASEEPWSMSWSNVPDYLDYKDFHNIAKSCSVDGKTIHSGYSSNWHHDVFGTSIIDYQGRDQVEYRTAIINTANDAVTMCYRMSGWDKFLRVPPPRNPINTTGVFGLEVLQFEEWSHYFFGIVQGGVKCNVVDVEHTFGSPLSPSHSSTIAFRWVISQIAETADVEYEP